MKSLYKILSYLKFKNIKRFLLFFKNHLFIEKRENFEIKRKIDFFRRRIIRYRNANQIIEYAISFLEEFLNTKSLGIFLWNEEKGGFEDVTHNSNIIFKIIEPEILILSEYDIILLKKNIETLSNQEHRVIIEKLFEKINSNIIIPLLLNESLLGFIYINTSTYITLRHYFEIEEFRYFFISTLSNSMIYKRLEELIQYMEDKIKERTEELKKTQSFLLQQEKMMTLGTMISGIAHELNTPVGAISASCINIISTLDNLIEFLFLKEEYQKFPAEFKTIIYYFIYYVATHKNNTNTKTYKLKKELRETLQKHNISYDDNLIQFLVDFFPPLEEKNLNNKQNVLNRIIENYQKINNEGDKKLFLNVLRQSANIILNLEVIHKSSLSIAKLVKSLRSYSRTSKKEFTYYNISDILENTLIIVGNTIKHNIEIIKIINDIPKIECDQNQIQQVFVNLIINAYQALKSSEINKPQIRIQIEPMENNKILIQIHDNGPGIPQTIIDKIWDPFFTTKPQGEGTGLGLGIVKNIVESHHGKIYCKSEPGNTTFFIELPINQPKENQPKLGKKPFGRYDWR